MPDPANPGGHDASDFSLYLTNLRCRGVPQFYRSHPLVIEALAKCAAGMRRHNGVCVCVCVAQ